MHVVEIKWVFSGKLVCVFVFVLGFFFCLLLVGFVLPFQFVGEKKNGFFFFFIVITFT